MDERVEVELYRTLSYTFRSTDSKRKRSQVTSRTTEKVRHTIRDLLVVEQTCILISNAQVFAVDSAPGILRIVVGRNIVDEVEPHEDGLTRLVRALFDICQLTDVHAYRERGRGVVYYVSRNLHFFSSSFDT
jgi:hypothetical protein